MKYRLGLDLGVGSIGSAVVELDAANNAKKIVDAGVRIFEVSEGAEDRRLKKSTRKNLARTKKRLELLAKKLYENDLWINEHPKGTDKLRVSSPYKIRYDALHEKLSSCNYIGRIILHLAKHRGAGFVSAKEDSDEEVLEEGYVNEANIDAYEQMYQNLKNTNSKTIGEFFYKQILKSYEKDEEGKKNYNLRIIRRKKYAVEQKLINYAIPRYLVKDEFNQIWDKQAEYYPQMNKSGLKQEVYEILFYERPAAPYATGSCIYIRDEKRLSKAHPLSELRRIYEEVNNVRIVNDMGTRKLALAERNLIITELLLKGKNAGKQVIKKLLNLGGQQKISLYEDKIIKAYLYSRPEFAEIDYIKSLSDEEFENFIEFLAEPINQDDKNGRLYNEDALIAQLKKKLKIDDEKKIGELLSKLPKNRVNLGKTATKLILDQLKKEVISHREVTDKLKVTDKRFEAAEEIAKQMQGKSHCLPYYGEILQTDTQPLPPLMIKNNKTLNTDEIKWGKIANPAVHMMLNQLRQVVNEIVKIYGRPYDINIELGRDVGMSSKRKKEFENKQKQNEKCNEEAKKHLLDFRLPITGKNILKYKLAKEQGWKDAYEPARNISAKFSGFEIEHIIPQAKGGTDTYNNMILVGANENLAKADKFAYEYFAENKTEEEIREILKNARNRLKDKAWRFEANAREEYEEKGDTDEQNRYLTDTRYVAKMAQRYLRAIVDCSIDEEEDIVSTRILPVRGQQTSKLRQIWWLDGLEYELMGLDVPRYIDCQPHWVEQSTGEIVNGLCKPDIDGDWRYFDKKKNPEWVKKPRIDHRHHAMDAITVACVNRGLIKKMSNESDLNKIKYPLPLSTIESVAEFRREVVAKLKEVKVSHKPNHSKLGQLHEETGKVKLCRNPDDKNALITVYVRKILNVVKTIKELNKILIPENIKDEWHENIAVDKQKQAKLVADFELYLNIAEQILIVENEKNIIEGKKPFEITDSKKLQKAFRIIQEKGLWKGDKFKFYENSSSLIDIEKHGVVYKSGNNHCIDFYEKDGKIDCEVINRFNANQNNYIPDWKKNGGKIIWSLKQGDLLEIDTPDEWSNYTDKQKCIAKATKFRFGRNQLSIKLSTDARNGENAKSKFKYMLPVMLDDKGVKWLSNKNARKIELTALGKMKRKHKVLWNGKKSAA